jgi:hypothetical protein
MKTDPAKVQPGSAQKRAEAKVLAWLAPRAGQIPDPEHGVASHRTKISFSFDIIFRYFKEAGE